jgi:copper chaperone CopZ
VQLVLERLDGVHNVEVSFQAKQAVVTYNPTNTTVEQMIEAVGRSGFSAEEMLQQ